MMIGCCCRPLRYCFCLVMTLLLMEDGLNADVMALPDVVATTAINSRR